MRQTLLILASIILLTSFSIEIFYIDPTGTYKLNSKANNKNGDTYGYSGQVQVKKISLNKIVMTFEVNKGAPSYNSGSFVDTLSYNDNKAIYTDTESDSTCKITFDFYKKGITVKEETSDYNSGCGFGHGVVANGFYKKTSSKMPILTKPLTRKNLRKKQRPANKRS